MNSHKMHPYGKGPEEKDMDKKEEIEPENFPTVENTEAEPLSPSEPSLEKQPDSLETVKASLDEERLRMAAEMDNFKKRLQREHSEQMRFAAEKVLADLLPALDNLDLAIQYGTTHEACADMMKGIELTRKQLLDAVAKSGLSVIGVRGEQFDPAIHEALGMEADPELEKGAVTRILQNGYKLNDRLLRPAKVMVNN